MTTPGDNLQISNTKRAFILTAQAQVTASGYFPDLIDQQSTLSADRYSCQRNLFSAEAIDEAIYPFLFEKKIGTTIPQRLLGLLLFKYCLKNGSNFPMNMSFNMSVRWSIQRIQIEKIGSAYIYIHISYISYTYHIHITLVVPSRQCLFTYYIYTYIYVHSLYEFCYRSYIQRECHSVLAKLHPITFYRIISGECAVPGLNATFCFLWCLPIVSCSLIKI